MTLGWNENDEERNEGDLGRKAEKQKSGQCWVGWHTGTAQVSKVQPGPVPAKPTPIQVQVQNPHFTYAGFCNTAACLKTHMGISFFSHFFLISS